MRLVLAISLDGRITFSKGGKGLLGGKGDRKILEKALAWSDATLMGSGTLKAHKNTCLIHNSKLIEKRKAEGKMPQPLCVVVSRKVSFSRKLAFFKQPVTRWLLSPISQSEIKSLQGFDRLLCLQDNWLESLIELKQAGCSKITVLGGAKLIMSLLSEDQIDELQLTLTPRLLGGIFTWIPSEMKTLPKNLQRSSAWEFTQMKELGNNEVMIQYSRNRN